MLQSAREAKLQSTRSMNNGQEANFSPVRQGLPSTTKKLKDEASVVELPGLGRNFFDPNSE